MNQSQENPNNTIRKILVIMQSQVKELSKNVEIPAALELIEFCILFLDKGYSLDDDLNPLLHIYSDLTKIPKKQSEEKEWTPQTNPPKLNLPNKNPNE
jgi:hypothetical protein